MSVLLAGEVGRGGWIGEILGIIIGGSVVCGEFRSARSSMPVSVVARYSMYVLLMVT